MTISLAWVTPVVAAQRLVELLLCRRNRLLLMAQGGREVRPDTYKTMVALHALFLLSLSWESYPWRAPADIRTWACLAVLRQRIRIEEKALREATDRA